MTNPKSNFVVSITDTRHSHKIVATYFIQSYNTISSLGYMLAVAKGIKELLGHRWGIFINMMDDDSHKKVPYDTMTGGIKALRGKLRELSNPEEYAALIKRTAIIGSEVRNIPANIPER